jgi:spermidine/putrescine-binding protein
MKRFVAVAALALAGCGDPARPPSRELHVYIWANYLDPAVVADFEREFRCKVIEESFDSNETMRSKLEAGATGYDVIVPSDYTVQALVKANLLLALDSAHIPNLKHVEARFRGLYYDPQNRFTVPYLWGTTGIGYDADRVRVAPASWGDLFEPGRIGPVPGGGNRQEPRPALRLGMLDDPRESIGAALKWKGHSINSTDPSELEEAKRILVAQKKYVARYDSETYDDMLATGDLDLAHGWSGEFARARVQSPRIRYVVPREGGVIWADNLAIPATSKNPSLAHAFIDFLLRPEISARLVNVLRYPSTNGAARAHIKAEILNDPGIYPAADVMDRLEWIRDVGEASDLYDAIWTELKNE